VLTLPSSLGDLRIQLQMHQFLAAQLSRLPSLGLRLVPDGGCLRQVVFGRVVEVERPRDRCIRKPDDAR
jgi:hypothetical protein